MTRMIFGLFTAVLVGCAVPYGANFSPAPAPAAGQALVYVLRANAAVFISPMVSLNGKPLFKLGVDGYTQVYLAPGRYVVTTENDHAPPFEFTVKANVTSALYLKRMQPTGPTRLSGIVVAPKVAPMMIFSSGPAPKHPYEWDYYENVAEFDPPFVYSELKARKFQEPLPSSFTPLP